MISDAPYQSEELVLPAGAGVIAGMVASGVMLKALDLISRSAPAVQGWPTKLGGLVGQPYGNAGVPSAVVGAVIHVVLGGMLGLLFAMCLQRVPVGAMLAVGLFYSVLLWVVGGVASRVLFAAQLQGAVRSVPYLEACIAYGLTLSAIAIVFSSRRKPHLVTVRD